MNIINAFFLISVFSFGAATVAMNVNGNPRQRKDSLKQQILLTRAQQRLQRKTDRSNQYQPNFSKNVEIKCHARGRGKD